MFMRRPAKMDELRRLGPGRADAMRRPNIPAGWAADHPAESEAGTQLEYLSAVSNILAQIVQAYFPDNEQYWDFSKTALFDPIGVKTATLETDTTGTWVGSSYLWASVRDWARLGELMLNDGQWEGQEVLPPAGSRGPDTGDARRQGWLRRPELAAREPSRRRVGRQASRSRHSLDGRSLGPDRGDGAFS